MEQPDKNYRTYLINWCHDMYHGSQELAKKLHMNREKRYQDWTNKIRQFQTSLERQPAGGDMPSNPYKTAWDLYNEWVQLAERKKMERKENTYQKSSLPRADHEEMDRTAMVGIGEHQLPPLPYPYDALEPYINREIMRLHHLKHHKSYVDGLNEAEREMQQARKRNDYKLIIHWERKAAFNGAGHYLHTIFWEIMSPKGGGRPSGKLREAIDQSFGSFEKFKEHFSAAANNVEGVGWAILVWAPRSHRMEILQAEKHQHLSQWDVIPILVLDVWEHAYYLQYKNNRKEYVKNWWNIVNWNAVEDRFREAQKLRWRPF